MSAEPWLRGPVPGVSPFIAPLLYSFEQAREDLSKFTAGLTHEQLWARPYGLNPVGRELKHIAGSVDRLTTYLEGRQLTERQMAQLQSEPEPDAGPGVLMGRIQDAFSRAEMVARSLDPVRLTDARSVGRKQLPTTVIGLVVHIAEHTQRHVGQAIAAAKLARAMRPGT